MEFEALEPTMEIEFNGMQLDFAKLEKLKFGAEANLESLTSELKGELNQAALQITALKPSTPGFSTHITVAGLYFRSSM